MVMKEGFDVAGRHPDNQDPTKQFAIGAARSLLENAGVIDPSPTAEASSLVTPVEKPTLKTPEASVKMYPEISLEQERARQIQGFIKLGFHTELSKTEEEYAARFPEFTSQPESFKGRMDAPALVETEISPKRQSELAGIQYVLDGLSKTDWNLNLKDYTAPEAPYAAWLDDGRNHMNKKVKDIRSKLKSDEIGGTELDGIALYISNPKILEHHFLDLPGTSVESDHAAYLGLWRGRPRLGYYFVDSAFPEFGSVVRGRQK